MVVNMRRWVVAVMLGLVGIVSGGCFDEPPIDLGDDYPPACLCSDTSDAGAADAGRVCVVPPNADACVVR